VSSGILASSGITCVEGATVKGGITVAAGATLYLLDSTVRGSISASRPAG
jgi:hypothetical protein